MKYLTREQIKAILVVREDPIERLLIRVLYYSGCRISEIVQVLTPRDIVHVNRILVVPALKRKPAGDRPSTFRVSDEGLFRVHMEQRGITLDAVPGETSDDQLKHLYERGIKGISEKKRITASKEKAVEPKRVVIDSETLRQLDAFIKARQIRMDQPIFPFDRWRAWYILKKAGATIGAPWIHPHTLRHSFAVHFASGGGDLVKLQRQLGHKKQSTTTDMYLQYSTADIKLAYDRVFEEGGK